MSDVLNLFLRDRDSEPEPPVLKGISIRLPSNLLAYVDQMAEHADLSRNGMAVQLLEWGVRYALLELPDEIRDEIVEAVDGPEAIALHYRDN